MKELDDWQKIDPSCGCVYPWFTHPFLEVLQTWNLRLSELLEYGGGRSTAWWVEKCAKVVTIETNAEWMDKIKKELKGRPGLTHWFPVFLPVNEGVEDGRETYVPAGDAYGPYDIIVIDGIHRHDCLVHAVDLLKNARGGIIIVDNWDQDGFLCPACVELMAPYAGHIYPQPDHVDHHGNCWKTAYFDIPSEA